MPARLLSSQPPLHQIKPITTGIKAIDKLGLLEVSWYTGQLKRISQGLPVKPGESGLWVFLKQAWHMLRAGQKKKRLRA